MSDVDDEKLFLEEMGDVAPIKKVDRVPLRTGEEAADLARRRQAAVAETTLSPASLTGDYTEPVGPHDLVSFKRPGIQHGVFKNLRLAKYTVDAQLDLHRMTVEQARLAVTGFIKDCVAHDVRCALINHGKGADRQPQPALLKSCVVHWLPQLEAVMAFHSAQKQHGGVGATYVLLKKSDKKRWENFEKQKKGR